METFYIVSLVIGGAFVLLNILSGGHGHDLDTNFDAGGDLDHGGDLGHGTWLPFLSLRFWTYFLMATGLTGLLLTKFSRSVEPTIMILSLATGLVLGLTVALIVRSFTKDDGESGVRVDELLGLEAQVLVTVRQKDPGKIRVHIKGETLDLLALAHEDSILEVGSQAIIVAMEKDRALVVPRDVLYG